MSEKSYTVGQVARMARVTVRTLHHYDEIGLLVPSGRTAAGYRIYDSGDLERLHEIVILRGLGLPLEEIREVLEKPTAHRMRTLQTHRQRLETRIEQTRAVIHALDRKIEALREGWNMDREEILEDFEAFEQGPYADEARERWGDTDAYRESARRTKHYTREQWASLKTEGERIEARWAELMATGGNPEDPEAMDVAENARLHIDRWFYPCSPAMHVGLAEMYEADPRFRAHYDSRAEGLAAFVAASIRANAARAG